VEVAASTEDDEIRCSGLAKRPEKNAKILPRGSLFVAGAPRRSHAGAQPQAPLRLTGPAPSAVERPPRSSLPRSLGRQLGGSRAASQRALTTRLGCSACREDVPDRTSALSLCRRAQRRRHHTFVRGGARRSCSRVQLHRRDLLASQSVLSAALWLSALPAPRGRGVFACKQVVTVLGVPPRPRGGGHVGSRRRRAETTGAGGAGPRPPDELQVRLPAAVGVEAPGDQQGARLFPTSARRACAPLPASPPSHRRRPLAMPPQTERTAMTVAMSAVGASLGVFLYGQFGPQLPVRAFPSPSAARFSA